jgi:heat shock protein HtpX
MPASAGIRETGTQVLPDNHPLTRMVHVLARQLQLPEMPLVGIYPDQDMNAFAAGTGPKEAVVSFSQGLVDGCTNRELMAIAAYEVAHIAKNDMRRMQ